MSRYIKQLTDPIKLRLRRIFFHEILVLGDSHAKVFMRRKIRRGFNGYFFTLKYVPGATVSGFQNPKSKTQALPIFRKAIRTSRAKTTIILLGEVDVGFVIWYRAAKHKSSVEEMLDYAISNYESLLLEISKKSRVICVSTVLPTIKDQQDWGDIANKRKAVTATQAERTQLTLEFNRRMKVFCESNGFTYLSLDNESIGDNGLVRENLLNPDRFDHHYDYDKYADMVFEKLKMVIK